MQGPYSIGVVAIEDSTTVQIHLTGLNPVVFTHNGVDYTSGEVCTISLDKYQTFQVGLLVMSIYRKNIMMQII